MSQRTPSHCSAICCTVSTIALAQPRVEGVELEHVGPGRKVRVAAAGKDLSPDSNERGGVFAQVLVVSLNEILGMRGRPGMVGGHVVGHEIEDQPQASLREHFAGSREPRGTAEVLVDDVAAHAIGRADIVLCRKVGKGPAEILQEALVPHGDFNPGRAPLPDAHEPHGVEAKGGNRIPLLGRHRGEIHRPLVFLAEFTQPDPGVDLVDDGMFGPGFHVTAPERLRRPSRTRPPCPPPGPAWDPGSRRAG